MRDLVRTMLGLGITVGLSDRDAFVKKVSGIIEEYQHNPEMADKWAAGIVGYLENMRDNINTHNIMKDVLKDAELADKDKIDELKKAIEELTKEVQHLKSK